MFVGVFRPCFKRHSYRLCNCSIVIGCFGGFWFFSVTENAAQNISEDCAFSCLRTALQARFPELGLLAQRAPLF